MPGFTVAGGEGPITPSQRNAFIELIHEVKSDGIILYFCDNIGKERDAVLDAFNMGFKVHCFPPKTKARGMCDGITWLAEATDWNFKRCIDQSGWLIALDDDIPTVRYAMQVSCPITYVRADGRVQVDSAELRKARKGGKRK